MTQLSVTLPIFNLTCGSSDALTLEHALAREVGVIHVYVNPLTEMAYIHYDPALANPGQLAAVIAHAGFGPPTPPVQQPKTIAGLSGLSAQRLALTAGIWLVIIYALCVAFNLLLPNLFQMYRLWEVLLPGVVWSRPLTLLLGMGEIFLYGLFGGWLFVIIQRQLARNLSRNAH